MHTLDSLVIHQSSATIEGVPIWNNESLAILCRVCPVLLLLLLDIRIRVSLLLLIAYTRTVWISSRIFMFFQICIHYFKMNSYFKMNRDYREAWLDSQSANHKPIKGEDTPYTSGTQNMSSSYPKNLNYRDFFMFLVHPTFTYQDSYPLRAERSWKTVFFRLLLIFISIVSVFKQLTLFFRTACTKSCSQ